VFSRDRKKAMKRLLQTDINSQYLAAALSNLACLGYKGLVAEDLHKLNKADQFEEEIIVMAEVTAYFHIDYKVDYAFVFVVSLGS
jgi:hypothetical protein